MVRGGPFACIPIAEPGGPLTRFRVLASISSATLIALGAALGACAHTPTPAEEGLAAPMSEAPLTEPAGTADRAVEAPAEAAPPRSPTERCRSMVGTDAIKREAVSAVVAAGLGQWLQGVKVERVLEGRAFKGWKIQLLHLENPCYAAVDLRPGDVVTAINGQGPKPLERPESAMAVFNSLASAPAIEVTYLREGAPRKLRFEIVQSEKP